MAGTTSLGKRKRIPQNPYSVKRSFKKTKYAPSSGSRSRRTFLKLENTKLKFETDVPDFMAVKARFAQQFTVTPGSSGIIGAYSFRANSVFDPDTAVFSKVAHGLFEYGQLYQKYTVVKTSFNIRSTPNSTMGVTENWVYGYRVSDNEITPGTNVIQLMQDPKVKWTIGGVGLVDGLRGFVDLAKEVGVLDILDENTCRGEASTSAITGTNPAQNMYINVFTAMDSAASSPKDIHFNIEIVYDVVFTNPRILADT